MNSITEDLIGITLGVILGFCLALLLLGDQVEACL